MKKPVANMPGPPITIGDAERICKATDCEKVIVVGFRKGGTRCGASYGRDGAMDEQAREFLDFVIEYVDDELRGDF